MGGGSSTSKKYDDNVVITTNNNNNNTTNITKNTTTNANNGTILTSDKSNPNLRLFQKIKSKSALTIPIPDTNDNTNIGNDGSNNGGNNGSITDNDTTQASQGTTNSSSLASSIAAIPKVMGLNSQRLKKLVWEQIRNDKKIMKKTEILRLKNQKLTEKDIIALLTIEKQVGIGQRLCHSSTLKTVPPPKTELFVHPASWLWKQPDKAASNDAGDGSTGGTSDINNWSLSMDEYGNTYYYNLITNESSWDPPVQLMNQYNLPYSELSFNIVVPEGIESGQVFNTEINGLTIEVLCPLGCSSGSVVELWCPTNNGEGEVNEEIGAYDGSIESNYDASYEGYDANNGTTDVDGQAIVSPLDDITASTTDETSNVADIVVDVALVWESLATVAASCGDYDPKLGGDESKSNGESDNDLPINYPPTGALDAVVLKTYSGQAVSIMEEISAGTYSPHFLFQLSWAYKYVLFEAAATAQYKAGGSFLDSSQFDNCDGTPRYAISGFVQWANDLVYQKLAIEEALRDPLWLESSSSSQQFSQTKADYANMRALALSGDDESLLSALIERKQRVSVELQNLQSRVLAVVCVEGGPSRESLDTIYELLKDQMQPDSVAMDKDEMDEFVSNHLQAKHEFMVEILLNLVLLEEELESLTHQIDSFVSKKVQESRDELMAQQSATALVVGSRTDSLSTLSNDETFISARSGQESSAATIASLVAQQEEAARSLEAQLFDKRRLAEQRMRERLSERRNARIDQLISENSQLTRDEAMKLVLAEEAALSIDGSADSPEAIARAEMESIASAEAEEMRLFHAKALAEIRRRGEEEANRVQGLLELKRDQEKAKLQDRLAKRKSDLAAAKASGSLSEEAEVAQLDVLQEEMEQEIDRIDSDCESKVKSERQAALQLIREQHDKESARIEQELLYRKEQQAKELKQRLEKRMQERAQALLASNAEIDSMTAVAIVEAEFAEEQRNSLETIDKTFSAAFADENDKIVGSLRELHGRETARLEDELGYQERKQRERLMKRLEKQQKQQAVTTAQESQVSSSTADQTSPVALSSDQEAELAESLSALKAAHEKQVAKLSDDLLAKKSAADRALQAKLQKRVNTGSAVQKANPASSGFEPKVASISVQDFIISKKSCHSQLQMRLQLLVEHLKPFVLKQKRDAEILAHADTTVIETGIMLGTGSSKTISSKVINAQTLLLFTSLSDNFAMGFKKKCLYEVMGVKALAGSEALTVLYQKHVDELESAHSKRKVYADASEKVLVRLERDLKSAYESSQAERESVLADLRNSGYSQQKVAETELGLNEHTSLSVITESRSTMFALAALWLDEKLLGDVSISDLHVVVRDENGASGQVQDDDDDDDGDDGRSVKSTRKGGNNAFTIKFGLSFQSWLQRVLETVTIYTAVMWNLKEALELAISKVNELGGGDGTSTIMDTCMRLLLRGLAQGFAEQLRDGTLGEEAISKAMPRLIIQICEDTSSAGTFRSYLNSISPPEIGVLLATVIEQAAPTITAIKSKRAIDQTSRSFVLSKSKSKRFNSQQLAQQKAALLLKALDATFESKNKALTDSSDGSVQAEEKVHKLTQAFEKLKETIANNTTNLDQISTDTLSIALDRACEGQSVTIRTLDTIQGEVERARAAEKTAQEVQRKLQLHTESADQLDVALKLQQAKEQQKLQSRLLRRRGR